MNLYASHRMEDLALTLGNNLYKQTPLIRKLVITPAKDFLLYYLADHFAISAGARFVSLDQGMEIVAQTTFARESRFPKKEILSIFLQKEILATESKELKQYLQGGSEMRLQNLSDYLAELFVTYGKYGSRFLPRWLGQKGWKQSLFKRVFDYFDYPIQYFQQEILPAKFVMEIHVYGISNFPGVYLTFLEKVSKQMPVFFYLFSPSPMYWGDLCSDRKRVALQRYFANKGVKEGELLELDSYLKKQNPLVANYATYGSHLFNELIERNIQMISEEKGNSLLHRLQSHMLELKENKIQGCDDSLELHRVPTRFREVEVLYHKLLHLMQKDKAIRPENILVMAPDILDYFPFIRFVFETGEIDLPFYVEDLTLEKQSHYFHGVKMILDLLTSHFEIEKFYALFSSRLFQKKFDLTENEIETFFSWAEEMKISWGLDKNHRREILREEGRENPRVESEGTFEHLFDRLIFGLTMAMSVEGDFGESAYRFLPHSLIPMSSAEWIGKLYSIVYALKEDLDFAKREKLTVENWSLYFETLINRYLAVNTDEDKSHQLKLEQCLHSLQLSLDETFPFSTIHRYIQAFLMEKIPVRKKRPGIRFCSLREGSSLAADIVYLIGMNEEDFPGSFEESSLDERAEDYFPAKIDGDRYGFLQAIFAARKHLMISYDILSQKDGKEKGPSDAVLDLFANLEQHERLTFSHPITGVTLQKEKKKVSLPDIFLPAASHKNLEGIEIQDLQSFAANPIRYYFNRVMGLYLRGIEKPSEKEMTLSSLEKHKIRQMMLRTGTHGLKVHEVLGKLPSGVFKEVVVCQIENEGVALPEFPEKHFHVHFKRGVKEPFQKGRDTYLPEKRMGKLSLYGTIPDLLPEGLVCFDKKGIGPFVRHWPLALIAFSEDLCRPKMIFAKEDKEISLEGIAFEKALFEYLDYFALASEAVSPLHPDWVSFVLFDEKLKDERIFDPYREWMIASRLDMEKIRRNWAAYFQEYLPIFMEVLRELL